MPVAIKQYCVECKKFTPHLPGGSKAHHRKLVMICECGKEYQHKLSEEQKQQAKQAFDHYIKEGSLMGSLILPAYLL
jgi:Tat protein secretion system quality control protein TatD with DNase activity